MKGGLTRRLDKTNAWDAQLMSNRLLKAGYSRFWCEQDMMSMMDFNSGCRPPLPIFDKMAVPAVQLLFPDYTERKQNGPFQRIRDYLSKWFVPRKARKGKSTPLSRAAREREARGEIARGLTHKLFK